MSKAPCNQNGCQQNWAQAAYNGRLGWGHGPAAKLRWRTRRLRLWHRLGTVLIGFWCAKCHVPGTFGSAHSRNIDAACLLNEATLAKHRSRLCTRSTSVGTRAPASWCRCRLVDYSHFIISFHFISSFSTSGKLWGWCHSPRIHEQSPWQDLHSFTRLSENASLWTLLILLLCHNWHRVELQPPKICTYKCFPAALQGYKKMQHGGWTILIELLQTAPGPTLAQDSRRSREVNHAACPK